MFRLALDLDSEVPKVLLSLGQNFGGNIYYSLRGVCVSLVLESLGKRPQAVFGIQSLNLLFLTEIVSLKFLNVI